MRIYGACSWKRPGTIATGRLSAPRFGDANGERPTRSSHRRGRPRPACIGATTVSRGAANRTSRSLPRGAAAVAPQQIGRHAGFVENDELPGIA